MAELQFPPGGEMRDPSPFVETRLGGMIWFEMLFFDLLILATMILRGGGPFSRPTMDDGVMPVSLLFTTHLFHKISQCQLQVLPAPTVRPK